jgi:hypothetical protein
MNFSFKIWRSLKEFYIFVLFCCCLTRGLTISLGQPGVLNPPALASQVLELQVYATMPGFIGEVFNGGKEDLYPTEKMVKVTHVAGTWP